MVDGLQLVGFFIIWWVTLSNMISTARLIPSIPCVQSEPINGRLDSLKQLEPSMGSMAMMMGRLLCSISS